MKTIGMIGGMSWESSVVYYQIVNRGVKARLGGSNSARSVMYSVNFGEIAQLQEDGDWSAIREMMIDAARRLEAGGADFIVICTNTMHMFADDMIAAVGIPLLHIGDATGEAIVSRGIKKVGLLGTKFTMEGDFLRQRLLENFGIETIIPDDNDRDRVHAVIYDELVKGVITDTSRLDYLKIIEKLRADGAEGIILGCTEIPLLVSTNDTDAVLFDTTALHAAKAVDLAFE